jgi:hypothetical protein
MLPDSNNVAGLYAIVAISRESSQEQASTVIRPDLPDLPVEQEPGAYS